MRHRGQRSADERRKHRERQLLYSPKINSRNSLNNRGDQQHAFRNDKRYQRIYFKKRNHRLCS